MLTNQADKTASRPQFQLLHATVIIAAIAIVLMISAPWIRAFNQSQWLAALRGGLTILAGLLFFWAILTQFQRNASLRAGQRLLVVNPRWSTRGKVWYSALLTIIFFLPVLLILFQIHTVGKSSPPTPWWLEVMNLFPPFVMTFQFILTQKFVGSTQFCEHGVLVGGMLLYLWKDLQKNYHWGASQPHQLRLIRNDQTSIPIQVDPDQREQVEAILRTHLTGFIQSSETSHSQD